MKCCPTSKREQKWEILLKSSRFVPPPAMTLMLCKRSTGRGAHWLSVGIAAGVLRVIPAAQPRPGGLFHHKELRMAMSVVPARVGSFGCSSPLCFPPGNGSLPWLSTFPLHSALMRQWHGTPNNCFVYLRLTRLVLIMYTLTSPVFFIKALIKT